MFTHDTAEAKNGEVDITDFDFETVKTAIDFCYGREMKTPSIETVVGMLRFADKYDIKSVTDQLVKMPRLNLSNENFPAIVLYAYDCSKDDLFEECCKFFEDHQNSIVAMEKFITLPPLFVAHLLKQTYNLNTPFKVLRYAQATGITFILDPLEQPIIPG
uniref:BTB domain-containing protein n=1 Tax=Panagrellus redivivus TaxID=6233 RepID=A0A7E4UZR4_PANRE